MANQRNQEQWTNQDARELERLRLRERLAELEAPAEKQQLSLLHNRYFEVDPRRVSWNDRINSFVKVLILAAGVFLLFTFLEGGR